MSVKSLYSKGTRLWLPDPEYVWRGGEVLEEIKTDQIKIGCEDGTEITVKINNESELPPLRNPDILIGENDLTSLSYLNEPEVLYNLQVRFCNHNVIYTYCGIVLVAINPYEELPIYDNDTIMTYHGHKMGDLDPHIFAVAEEAFTQMEREESDQSIIVSGESGAGKTVSAKYAMRYFATVGGSSTETQVEKKVLASNPIMEAIGNAKTTRNDNSSRFGKYIEIDFNKHFNIIGANMRTYLLEKSRVVFQTTDERNYHIFYQLCASRDLDALKNLALDHQDNFRYTNQGESPVIEGTDDLQAFEETRKAFSLLGFSLDTQLDIFRILSAILHLGNVNIVDSSEDADACMVPADDAHLCTIAELLGIDLQEIRLWLCFRQIVTTREVFTKPMSKHQAAFARDALAKHIYAQLFDWIVTHINKCLASKATVHKFIGVLDIYGFETFEINSFEQFCINYANEKLQQQFNQHVFKLEQEEYVREQIEWKFIDFYDNQPCINLIENKMGILDLLDEECRMPKGTDETWVNKLYDKCKSSKHFTKPRLSNTAFNVCHFADTVQYESSGFLEKNRDTVLEEQINILKKSNCKLVIRLFGEDSGSTKDTKLKVQAAQKTSTLKKHKKTVGSQFRDSLGLLMATLNSTTPHYVRCIKPNDGKSSFVFEPQRAVQQLRACGVLETIRISAAGFPSRWMYQEFLTRYRVLIESKHIDRNNMKSTAELILNNVIQEEDKYKFGKTKIFFRAGQVAYLEKLRSDRLKACCNVIQKNVRMWLQQKRFRQIKHSVVRLQTLARGMLARRKAVFLRETRAAIVIQKHVRGFIERRKYLKIKHTILQLQCFARGKWARAKAEARRQENAIICIQRFARGILSRRATKKKLEAIICLQSYIRRMYARRELKRLKIEARSVEHIKNLNKGLENKIMSLQRKIQELNKETSKMKSQVIEVDNLRLENKALKSNAVAGKEMSNKVVALQDEIKELHKKLQSRYDEKMDLINEKEQMETLFKEREEVLQKEKQYLSYELKKAEESLSNIEKTNEENVKQKVESVTKVLLKEFDEERSSHQKLLKDFGYLEQRYENLQDSSRLPVHHLAHHRTPSNISTLSLQSDATELVRDDQSLASSEIRDDDMGYGSVRSSSTLHTETTESLSPKDGSPSDIDKNVIDISLVLKLQQKLKEVETERTRLEKRLDSLEGREQKPSGDENKYVQELIRLQELEMENVKLRDDLSRLRKSIADGQDSGKDLMSQFDAMQDELVRRRDECVQLKTVLANHMEDVKSLSQASYGGETDFINEDGELLMAFQTQKHLMRQLESELQSEKKKYISMEQEYKVEMKRLQEDNERQQRLISQNLQKTPQAQNEAYMQHEITRLTGENLDLREKIDLQSEQIKKLKKQLKIYVKKLKDAAGHEHPETEVTKEVNEMPLVRHKEVEYLGMFEYRKEDEPAIVKNLIYDLKPRIAVSFLPGLPAYVLFMCIRHTDYINDDEKVRSLLTSIINTIKRTIRKRHEDLETTVLWLANTCRLLHNLKQYSGDTSFQAENSTKQNEQCLRNFDLSEYRQVLSDIAVWIYQAVIKLMEEKVQQLIVPAVLEHEAIPGISGKPSGMRGRSSSVAREIDSPIDPQRALDTLVKELTGFSRIMNVHGVDPELLLQVFKQIFYFICAGALNNLLLRKDMCHWSKGMQIRYNLSHLEQWCRDQKLQDVGVTETLQPVIQASQLLQARKTDDDVQSICDMCIDLTVAQIIKILNLYTPADEFEERVPISFIRKIQAKLSERDNPQSQSTLLMDTKLTFPVRFPFNPSNVRLEDIEVPDAVSLPVVKKI